MASGGYRPGSGAKKGQKYRPRGSKKEVVKKDEIPQDIIENVDAENKTNNTSLTPLEYMLKVMNDPLVDINLRIRMAVSAAPFIHSRKGEGAGKKVDNDEKAKVAGAGRFASMANKLKLVK
jgi:hypothetical protein